jgi:hypothetical protein
MTLEHCMSVAESLHYEYMSNGEQIFCLGDVGDKFYIIIDGEVSVSIYNKAYDAKLKEIKAMMTTVKKLRSSKDALLSKINAMV